MRKDKSILYLLVLFMIFVSNMFLTSLSANSSNNVEIKDDKERNEIRDDLLRTQGTTKEWIKNPSFEMPIEPWYNETSGDITDVKASASDERANFEVLGDKGVFGADIYESYPNSSGQWITVHNPTFPIFPVKDSLNRDTVQSYGIDTKGWWCAHDYQENGQSWAIDNCPSIHWSRNYTLSDDLTDYTITSVYVNATVNGTCWATDQAQNGGVECLGDDIGSGEHNATGDFARFYIMAANIEKTHSYEFAVYKTVDLGRDPGVDYMSYMSNIHLTPQDQLILRAYMTAIFQNTVYSEFTITLGIDIYCEDNVKVDLDRWKELRFNTFDFNFTYEKKMNRYAAVSWNQECDQINGTLYQIDSAKLNFEYKINQTWPEEVSPNSELRFIFNNNVHTETIKLHKATTDWKPLRIGGMDVTSSVLTNVNISVTIELIIMDNCELNKSYLISIDNVSLMITYSYKSGSEIQTKYDLRLNGQDATLSREITVKFGEKVNISFAYQEDPFGTFIPDATVQITILSETKDLTENDTLKHYNITVDSIQLGVGNSYLLLAASKYGYESQDLYIKIVVISLETSLHLFLNTENRTLEKATEVTYGEPVNITVKYIDIDAEPDVFISNASVQLVGFGSTKDLSENDTFEQYNITIDSTYLGLGNSYLTVTAQKENYTTLSIVFKIEVNERDTFIDNVMINETETLNFEVDWNLLFNISISYNDTITKDFISGATVRLESADFNGDFTEDIGKNRYRIEINSFDLKIGIKYLTVTAQKENYTIATKLITIVVNEESAYLAVYLNQTLTTSIDIEWNQPLNITAIYKDSLGSFIDGALVQLKKVGIIIDNFTKHSSLDQYNLTINTYNLNLGSNALSVYAKKDNFTLAIQSILIYVYEKETALDIFMNQTRTNIIEYPYGEMLNITAVYKDFVSGSFIYGAVIQLKELTTVLYSFSKHPSFDQYNLTLNTSDLGIGVRAFVVYAKQDNYTVCLESITITVSERLTTTEVFLNSTMTLAINYPYDEELNITAIYKDLDNGNFLAWATVELRLGGTKIGTFTQHPTLNQYNFSLNTRVLGVGIHALVIYAKKENYTVSLTSITINVDVIETNLIVMVDGFNIDSFQRYNISAGEYLNITAIYSDYNGTFLFTAMVDLIEMMIEDSLVKHPTLNQYNLTIAALDFGIGQKFITISAQKYNYKSLTKFFTIFVSQRNTTLVVTVNNTIITEGRTYTAEIDQYLNITVWYRDYLTNDHLFPASVSLSGRGSLQNHLLYDQYNITISTNTLNQGVTYLTIIAEKDGYETRVLNFMVQITERQTNYTLFLNEIDRTVEESIKVSIGELVNITVLYVDLHGIFIENANVSIRGEEIPETELTRHPDYEQYNITISTLDLGVGVNVLTLYIYKANYEQHTIKIVIEIIQQPTKLVILINDDSKTTVEKYYEMPLYWPLKISVQYLDNETGQFISGATLELRYGALFIGNLTESGLEYIISLPDTSFFDFGLRILTIEARKNNYQSQTENLRINVRRIRAEIETVSGEIKIDIAPGESYTLEIRLKDVDYGGTIKGATVTYTAEFGDGKLTDDNDDGIYEVLLENVVEGTYTITITAYAGDDYEFDRYEVSLNVIRPQEQTNALIAAALIGTIAAGALATYSVLNQLVFKVPAEVRKIRKFRRSIKTGKPVENLHVNGRGETVAKMHKDSLSPLKKAPKLKPGPEVEKTLLHEKVMLGDKDHVKKIKQ